MHFKVTIDSTFGGNTQTDTLIIEANNQVDAMAQAVHSCRTRVTGANDPEFQGDEVIFYYRPGVRLAILGIVVTTAEEYFSENLYNTDVNDIDKEWALRTLEAIGKARGE